MITEDYVSYEIAKLLKEKGFDANIYTCYTDCEFPEFLTMIDYVIQGEEYERSNFESHNLIQAPTHQMALKWLREVHNLHITIKPYITEEGIMYLFEIYKLEAEKFTLIKTKTGFEKSELANEAAIKYTLENLI